MSIDRMSFLTSNVSSGKAGRALKAGLCLTWLVVSLTACAQQADLAKVEKDLGGKITKLDQEKRALAQVLKQAKEESADALERQKAELNEELVTAQGQLSETIMKARAQLNSDLRNLREESLPKAMGDMETQIHQVRRSFENAVNRQTQRISALQALQEQRETELSKQIDALGQSFERALQQQGQTVKDQFVAFQKSLGQLKDALTDVNQRLDREAKRSTGSETKIRQDFDRHLQVFRAKLDADTKTLKTYLETEVKTAIEAINVALNEGNRNLKADIDAQATRLSELNAKLGPELSGLRQTDAMHGKDLEAVTLSLAQLRDVLGATGTQLGTKLDSQGKGLERTAKRIEELQGQHTALAKKLDADLKGLHGYLDKDVRPSLESIANAFSQEKNQVSQEFIKVTSDLRRVEQASALNVTQTQQQLESQAKHVQELSEAVAGMREVLDSMAGMLGNRTDQHMNQLGQLTARLAVLEKELAAEAAKQATNTQAVSTHLDDVTSSVQSVGQSLEQFQNLMSAKLKEQANRIDAQARQVSESTKSSAAVSKFQQGLKTNVTQLNELTKSVAQLKAVVKAMGAKLGSKVDAHESQLIEVEQALKQFKRPAAATPSKSKK